MKKILSMLVALLLTVSPLSLAACETSKNVAETALAAIKTTEYLGLAVEGGLAGSLTQKNEQFLDRTNDVLVGDSKIYTCKATAKGIMDTTSKDRDSIIDKTLNGNRTVEYAFVRSNNVFSYSAKEEVADFTKTTLSFDNKITSSSPIQVTPDFSNIKENLAKAHEPLLNFAKATSSLTKSGNLIKIDLNNALYVVVKDIASILNGGEDKITLNTIFNNERIKKYFSEENYNKIKSMLSSKEMYDSTCVQLVQTLRSFGINITLPQVSSLGEIDITPIRDSYNKATEKITKTQFIILNTQTNNQSETSTFLSFSGAEIVYTIENAVLKSVNFAAKLDASFKIKSSLSDYTFSSDSAITGSLDIGVKFLEEKPALIDINNAKVNAPFYSIPDGVAGFTDVTGNPKIGELLDSLYEDSFRFPALKVFTDSSLNITNVVATTYYYGESVVRSQYDKTEKTLTIDNINSDTPHTLYLNFKKESYNSGDLLVVEVYPTAEDRMAKRLMILSGEISADNIISDDYSSAKSNPYYFIVLERHDYDLYVKPTFTNGIISDLHFVSDFETSVRSEFDGKEGKVRLYFERLSYVDISQTYYIGIVSSSTESIQYGLYKNSNDAMLGGDCYELTFSINRNITYKLVSVIDYINKNFYSIEGGDSV